MFNIAVLNPLRFVDTSEINYSFDGNFAVQQVLNYQNPKCYFQKWQFSDVLRLQVLSDFVPTDLVFREVFSDMVVASVSWSETSTVLVDQTFKVYELDFVFSGLPDGKYYAEFSYIDENNLDHVLRSEPMCVSASQENTLLINYKNSTNDFDTIFETDIEFSFRVESAIKDYSPGNNRAIYNDQRVNPTLLSAIPFRKFRFYIGFQYGVPAWVFDKVNFIQSVDQVKYNNVYYQIGEGSDYEVETNEDNNFIGGSIDVQPTENNFNKYKTLPSDEANLISDMARRIDYFNISDDFPIAGFFKSRSLLEQVLITKRAPAADLTIRIGTTPGGDEIGEFDVDDLDFIQTTPKMFTATTTVYVSGIAGKGADLDITFLYLQTDAPPIDIGQGSGNTPAPELGLGSVIEYEEASEGDIDLDFNVSTGLGRANTKWYGWAICDGRNGTLDRRGRSPIMMDANDPDFDTPGKTGGAKTHALTADENGPHKHDLVLPTMNFKNDGGGGPDVGRDGGDNRSFTDRMQNSGIGKPHNNMHPYIVSIWVKKIA